MKKLLLGLVSLIMALSANAQCPLTQIATIGVGTNPYGVAVSSNGSMVYVANFPDNTVSVINTVTNMVTATVGVGTNPYGVAISPDDSMVYVTNDNGNNVSVISTATNTVTATIGVGTKPFGVAVRPDGSAVYVANFSDNTVSVINTATNTVTTTVSVGSYPYYLAISPDGSKVYVADQIDGIISVISTATNTVTATVSVGSYAITGVAVSPDGSKVYVGLDGFNPDTGEVDTVSVISAASNTVTASIGVGGTPNALAVSPDGSMVYVSTGGDNTVSVINTATNTVTATAGVGSNPYGVAVSPDGSKVYVASYTNNSVSVLAYGATHGITDTTCGSYTLNGSTYTASGTYIQTLAGAAATGCDSIITLNLVIKPMGRDTVTQIECSTYTWAQNGQTYTATGMYNDTLSGTAASGCDSIITLNLTINHSDTTYLNDTVVGSYTFNGDTLTASGKYYDTLVNETHCDSLVVLNLVITTTTGINDIAEDAIKIYPNPATDMITVSGVKTGTEIRITNLLGEVIFTTKAQSETQSLSIANLASGLYFLNNRKFVKQ